MPSNPLQTDSDLKRVFSILKLVTIGRYQIKGTLNMSLQVKYIKPLKGTWADKLASVFGYYTYELMKGGTDECLDGTEEEWAHPPQIAISKGELKKGDYFGWIHITNKSDVIWCRKVSSGKSEYRVSPKDFY